MQQANHLERMKHKVFQQGLKATDELASTVLHMRLKAMAIPRAPETYYSETSSSANLYRLPWHSSDWKESLKIATPDQVRHCHRCFIAELRESLDLMARNENSEETRALQTRNALDVMAKGTSMLRFMLNFNPLALLANLARNLETGAFNEQDEQFSRSLAQFALNLFSAETIEKLRGGVQVFHDQLGKIQAEKALLSNLLNYHLKSDSESASNQLDSLSYLSDLARLPQETQSLLLGPLPSSPVNPVDDSLTKLIEDVGIYRGSKNMIDELTTCIQKTVSREIAARSLLLQVVGEAVSPVIGARIQVRSYPYFINMPKFVQDVVYLHDVSSLRKK